MAYLASKVGTRVGRRSLSRRKSSRSYVRATVTIVLALTVFGAAASVASGDIASPTESPSPSPVPSPFDDPVADAAARTITAAQLRALIHGIFAGARSLAMDDVSPVPGVVQEPIYRGKQSDGKYHIASEGGGLACLHFARHTEDQEADCFGAILSFAADSDHAGTVMKMAYDRATDKRAFARVLGRALQLENSAAEAKADANVAYMRTLPIGAKRADIYAKLRARSIVVVNGMFTPGKPVGSGCDFDPKGTAAEYPTYGEPLPPQRCGPNYPPTTSDFKPISVAPKSPSASATFERGFDLACGYEQSVELVFDDGDRLSDVTVSPERHSCL